MEHKTLRLKHGIGYEGEDDSEEELDIWGQLEKEEKVEAKKKTLKETFVRERTGCSYKGTPEPILMAGEVIPGFEKFTNYVNGVKKANVTEVFADASVEELIVTEEEPKEDTVTPKVKATDGQNEKLDLEAYILNSIIDLFYDDYNVSLTALFKTDDLFYSKMNAMKSNFAYLCDVLPNDYSVCDDHFMHIFYINST